MMLNVYIFIVVERIEHVVRQTAEQIDDKPRLQVVHADHLRVAHDLTARSDKRGVKVKHCKQVEQRKTSQK